MSTTGKAAADATIAAAEKILATSRLAPIARTTAKASTKCNKRAPKRKAQLAPGPTLGPQNTKRARKPAVKRASSNSSRVVGSSIAPKPTSSRGRVLKPSARAAQSSSGVK
jgi:hypothetical protein